MVNPQCNLSFNFLIFEKIINNLIVSAEHRRFRMVLRVGAPYPSDCGRVLGHHLWLRHQGMAHPDQDRARLPAIHLLTDQANHQELDAQTVLLTHDLRNRFGLNCTNIFLQFDQ